MSHRAERKARLSALQLEDNFAIECVEKIKLITSKDLQLAANKYLNKPILSLCGPRNTIMALSNIWQS